jgi:hypothetical protein
LVAVLNLQRRLLDAKASCARARIEGTKRSLSPLYCITAVAGLDPAAALSPTNAGSSCCPQNQTGVGPNPNAAIVSEAKRPTQENRATVCNELASEFAKKARERDCAIAVITFSKKPAVTAPSPSVGHVETLYNSGFANVSS